MAGSWVTVKGTDSLRKKVQALASEVQGPALEEALAQGAVLIQDAAKRFAPVHEGTLRKSIHIAGHEELASDYDGNYPRGKNKVPDPQNNGLNVAIHVGTDIIYGAQKEYGGTITAKDAPRLVWRDYEGNWHSAISVYQNPQPFMRPAVDENLGPLYRKVAAELVKRIKKAVR